jgi:hypothetical protein
MRAAFRVADPKKIRQFLLALESRSAQARRAEFIERQRLMHKEAKSAHCWTLDFHRFFTNE